jgi:acyl transferase domain-containing protein
VLKRLEDAIRDNDQIYATIKGAALNNDGSDKASFTAPSVRGQAEVIAMAQADAGVSPSEISYVETHGTATPLGDPIEVEALTLAFGGKTNGHHCVIGSIKSNIGHLTPAAGAAGVIKTALALARGSDPFERGLREPEPCDRLRQLTVPRREREHRLAAHGNSAHRWRFILRCGRNECPRDHRGTAGGQGVQRFTRPSNCSCSAQRARPASMP